MALSIRDFRHIALVALIIAALPMLIYPKSIGLNFQLGMPWYILMEIAFFYLMAVLLNSGRAQATNFYTALLFLAGRFTLSFVLVLFLLAFESISFSEAVQKAFSLYKPAILLFTVASPFLFNSTFRRVFPEPRRKLGKVKRVESGRVIGAPMGSQPVRHSEVAATSVKQVRAMGENLGRSFADAVQHIGGYSGVLSAMLIDEEGLSVASWQRGDSDREMWPGLAKKIVETVDDINFRAKQAKLDQLEFRSGDQRFFLHRVGNLWLLSIADAASDELEKIRVHQAAEMVIRHCQERYKNVYMTETGRTYAGSTV